MRKIVNRCDRKTDASSALSRARRRSSASHVAVAEQIRRPRSARERYLFCMLIRNRSTNITRVHVIRRAGRGEKREGKKEDVTVGARRSVRRCIFTTLCRAAPGERIIIPLLIKFSCRGAACRPVAGIRSSCLAPRANTAPSYRRKEYDAWGAMRRQPRFLHAVHTVANAQRADYGAVACTRAPSSRTRARLKPFFPPACLYAQRVIAGDNVGRGGDAGSH